MANENARALRKRMTPQEIKLWVKLRELKAFGFHFRRQAPIDHTIVDFALFSSRLVIEVDGGQHGMPEGARSDKMRNEFLRSQGFRVLRFWNSDIDGNLDGVMENTPHPTGLRPATLPTARFARGGRDKNGAASEERPRPMAAPPTKFPL
jgi:very-short-patch-repair endonuclease